MRIVAETYSSRFPDAVRLASNEEPVQVLIRPAKSDLKCIMELGNGAVAAHQQATPDLGTDFADPDTQLIDLRRLFYAAHALPLLSCSPSQSISALAHEEKQDGIFIASRWFAPGMEWWSPRIPIQIRTSHSPPLPALLSLRAVYGNPATPHARRVVVPGQLPQPSSRLQGR